MTTVTEPKNLEDILEIAKNAKLAQISKINEHTVESVNQEGKNIKIEGYLIKMEEMGYITSIKIIEIDDKNIELSHKFQAAYYPLDKGFFQYFYDPNNRDKKSENKKVHDIYIEAEATYYESE